MVQKVKCYLQRTKELFLFQKATNIIMKSGKQDKALTLINECLAIINQMQKSKKKVSYPLNLYQNKKNSLEKLGFLSLASNSANSNSFPYVEDFKSVESHFFLDNGLSAPEIIEQAINNVSPFLEVRKVRTSRNTKQVPSMIKKKRQQTLAIRWIIEAAQQRKRKSSQKLSKCLAIEFLEAYSRQGKARQKRNDMHKIAYANRAHLRSRWW